MEDSVVEMNESLDLDSEHLQALIHETDALKATEVRFFLNVFPFSS